MVIIILNRFDYAFNFSFSAFEILFILSHYAADFGWNIRITNAEIAWESTGGERSGATSISDGGSIYVCKDFINDKNHGNSTVSCTD